jgi:hypothetical protein
VESTPPSFSTRVGASERPHHRPVVAERRRQASSQARVQRVAPGLVKLELRRPRTPQMIKERHLFREHEPPGAGELEQRHVPAAPQLRTGLEHVQEGEWMRQSDRDTAALPQCRSLT